MGCTSSAPNMATPQENSEKQLNTSTEIGEKAIEDVDEVIYTEKEHETNIINVLPTCDTLGDPTHLARNNKSFIDTSSLDLEKGSEANGHVRENNNEKPSVEHIANEHETIIDSQGEDKLSSLEEVVEKVVELYGIDNVADNQNSNENSNNITDKNVNDEKPNEIQTIDAELNEVIEEQYPEDIVSPSQSESSRATRWEALADIAAELPPSLAVDPITGQIYALSK